MDFLKRKRWFIGSGVFVSLIVLLFSLLGFLVYKFFMYRTDTRLGEDLLITDQWQEIDVKDVLPPLSQDTNRIYVAAPPSYEAFNVNRGIVAPDGTVIEPEVEVVDTKGRIHSFVQSGARRGSQYEMAAYVPQPEIQQGVQIAFIRLRSKHPVRVPLILWSSYDSKDLP